MSNTFDLVCIGAGPTGLASAIEAKRAGMRPLVIDKGCLCNSIFHYPVNMTFFTTPELLEIGDLPMTCATEKPTRVDALKYYRKATEHYQLELRLFETVRDCGRARRQLRRPHTHVEWLPEFLPCQENRSCNGVLRSSEPTERSRGGAAWRFSLLLRSTQLLGAGCCNRRRKEFRCGSCPRTLPQWRPRDSGSSARGTRHEH